MPTGQVPALEYNGEFICQSNAIVRFLAREFNLAGKNNLEQGKIDMILDTISEAVEKYIPDMFEKDEAKKKELHDKYMADVFPNFVATMESFVVKNGGNFLVGSDVTVADIYIMHIMMALSARAWGEEWKGKAPTLAKLVEKIQNLPNIKKWIETRPKTEA